MAIKIVGGTSFIFAAGVVAARYSGAPWSWAVVQRVTEMALFGTTQHLLNRFMPKQFMSIGVIGLCANSFLSCYAGSSLANYSLGQERITHNRPLSSIAAQGASLLALVLCVDFVSQEFHPLKW